MQRISVVVVSAKEIVRAGLRQLLARSSSVDVLGSATDGAHALSLVERLIPRIVVTDLWLPDRDCATFCAALSRGMSPPRVIAVLDEDDPSAIRDSFRAGVRGFVHAEASADELVRAIRDVDQRRVVLDPRLASGVMDEVRGLSRKRPDHLSQREAQVMRLITGGASDQEIACVLDLSPNTVKTYVRRSLDKLACRTRSEAAAKLVRRATPTPS